MQYKFLCPQHRAWLENKPEKVEPVWAAGMETAQRLVARGEWHQALRHVGCAFEAARIMVSSAVHCNRDWLRRWNASEALLRMVVARLGGDTAVLSPVPVHATPMVH